jgi:hypothetical protein
MNKKFILNELRKKLDIHYSNLGESTEIDYNSINILEVDSYGFYEIIYENSLPIKLKKLNKVKIEITNGKYFILDENKSRINGYTYNRQLFSSQFIELNIEKYREERIKKLLK